MLAKLKLSWQLYLLFLCNTYIVGTELGLERELFVA